MSVRRDTTRSIGTSAVGDRVVVVVTSVERHSRGFRLLLARALHVQVTLSERLLF